MVLLTKRVDVVLNGKLIKHYSSLDYKIPTYKVGLKKKVRLRTVINVDVDDLPPNSDVMVKYNCDICGDVIHTTYRSYNSHRNKKDICRVCYYVNNNGENHNCYNHKITDAERELRKNRVDIGQWRDDVFLKDNYTCQKCLVRGGYLNAHHLNSYASYPTKRLDVSNGITLCYECHVDFHSKYGWKDFSMEDFELWIMKIK